MSATIKSSTILGRYFIVRKRVAKKRPFTYQQGKVFSSVHGGLWSVYWEHKKGRNTNISIDDR